MTVSTRGRLMAAGLELFAERGFRGTTVGDIEAAAGLTARGGALYKHFKSKRELLEAAFEEQIHEVQRMRAELLDLLPLDDLRAELTLLTRWVLSELGRMRDLNAVIEKEGDSFPELRERLYVEIVEPGYRSIAEMVGRWNTRLDAKWDPELVAAVAGGALVNFRRNQWTFGQTLLDVDEERFVQTLVDMFLRLAPKD